MKTIRDEELRYQAMSIANTVKETLRGVPALMIDRNAGGDIADTLYLLSDKLCLANAQTAALLATIKAVEWVAIRVDFVQMTFKVCPSCFGEMANGHGADCPLAAAIAKAES